MGREYKLRRTPSESPVPAEGTAKTSPLDSSLKQRQKTTRQPGRGNCVDGGGWFSRCTVAESAKEDLKQCRTDCVAMRQCRLFALCQRDSTLLAWTQR